MGPPEGVPLPPPKACDCPPPRTVASVHGLMVGESKINGKGQRVLILTRNFTLDTRRAGLLVSEPAESTRKESQDQVQSKFRVCYHTNNRYMARMFGFSSFTLDLLLVMKSD
jgi:hypothetical protein